MPTANVGHEVSFLIDTGADTTCLSGLDSVSAGLTPADVGDGIAFEEVPVRGVDQTVAYQVEEPVILAFEDVILNDEGEPDQYSMHLEFLDDIRILPRSPQSLLGRDILDRFTMNFSSRTGVIEMDRDNFTEGMYLCMSMDEEMSADLRTLS